MVENRVKVLQKEEERMIKKIEEARKQAMKMAETHEANNSRYRFMMQFRLKQNFDNEMLKQRNAQMKSTRNIGYHQRKEDILKKN